MGTWYNEMILWIQILETTYKSIIWSKIGEFGSAIERLPSESWTYKSGITMNMRNSKFWTINNKRLYFKDHEFFGEDSKWFNYTLLLKPFNIGYKIIGLKYKDIILCYNQM